MSYSITVRAANKAEAKTKVAAELDKVVAQQPAHAHDRAQAEAATFAFIDLVADDDTQDVYVYLNGSVSGRSDGSNQLAFCSSAGVSVSASLGKRGH